jgi:hypothetical protein
MMLIAVLCLLFSATAFGQMSDLKGKMMATGHLGYALGMGDAFADFTEPFTNTEFSSGPGIGFGGQFYYGIQDNWLIGGELMFQSYTFKMSTPANLTLGIPEMEVSESQTELNILANAMYAASQTKNSTLFLLGGAGMYDFGGMKMGLNSGLVWRHQVSDNVYLFGMPRFHVVFADSTPMMVQLTMGAQFSFGS